MSKISLPRDKEKQLVKAAQQDPDKFAELYDYYFPHIRRFFAVKLNEAAVIEDLTALTFEKALRNIQKFEWKGYPFSAWLYRIAHNTLVDFYRNSNKQKYSSLENQVVDIPEEKAGLDEQIQKDWEAGRVNQLVFSLPSQQQQILILKFYEGYSNGQIAKELGISETNVGTIVHRLVKKLRKDLLN